MPSAFALAQTFRVVGDVHGFSGIGSNVQLDAHGL